MAADLILGIVPTVVEYTLAPAKRHLSCAFKCSAKVKELEDKVNELVNQVECLQHAVEEESLRGREIEKYVTEWESRADKAIGDAQKLVAARDEEAAKRCFFQSCPNLKSRYLLGRKAEAATSGITELLRQKDGFQSISYRAPLKPVVKPALEGYGAPSRAKVLDEVMEALRNSSVKMVGVYGMGGVGKTTLANELLRQVMHDKSFDPVVMVVVSATPVVSKIQGEITDVLGLKFEQETEVGRACQLHQTLMKKTGALVILDDLWKPLELEKVGIPFGNDLNGPKIFMTSRSEDVLVGMGSRNNFGLQVMSDDEARILFEMTVGEVKDTDLAKNIVQKCAGYPLSIVTIAGLLRNKDLSAWNDILQQLSWLDNHQLEHNVYKVLELSYHYLVDEELKSLFLLCGLLGQSTISTHDLLNYCLGLGLFKHVHTVSTARDRLLKLINDLKSASLILEHNKEKEQVKMHDVVRDTAALIASRTQQTFTIKDDNKLEEWPSNYLDSKCSRISLPYCDIDELPQNLECPSIEFFAFIAKSHRSIVIPDTVFEGCKKLKVLNFTEIIFSSLPTSLGSLVNLRTLCLHRCELSDVTIIGQLKKLEVLSLKGSKLEQLPCETGQLARLKLLDLSNCSKLTSIPANVLSRLSLLEELCLIGTSINWEFEEKDNISNASLSELRCLSRLTTLEICIPTDKRLPEDLMFTNLKKYRIVFGRWRRNDSRTSMAKMLKVETSSDLPHFISSLLTETEDLHLGNIQGTRNVLFDLESEGFQKLRQLRITNALELQHIVDSTKFVHVAFPLLESLHIEYLNSLESICHHQLSPGSFGRLRVLSVSGCNRLGYVFSLSLVQCLSQLEKLEIRWCRSIEAIVVDENDSGEGGSTEVVEFPRLLELSLSSLDKLGGFFGRLKASSETNILLKSPVSSVPASSEIVEDVELRSPPPLFGKTVSFPRLEKLSISLMDNFEEIWHNHLVIGSFSKLKSLEVQNCDNLRIIFQAAISERFLFLERLAVNFCKLLEDIYQSNERLLIEEKKGTVASELRILALSSLPKLKHIWGEEQLETLTLNCLQSVRVSYCQSLKNLFPSSLAKSLSQLKDIDVSMCGMEEIISGKELIAPCFYFPELTSLKLSRLPHMTMFYPGKYAIESPKLKCLWVSFCDKAITILPSTLEEQGSPIEEELGHTMHQRPVFSANNIFWNLEELSIDGKNLKTIADSPSWIEFLGKLKSLELCSHRGTTLFGAATIEFFRRLSSLEKLSVSSSYFAKLHSYDEEDSLRLPHLRVRSLRLYFIRSLKHLWELTSQKDLLLSGLSKLNLSFCNDLINLAPSSSVASFWNLTSLEVSYCHRLTTLITMPTAKTMVQLEKLELRDCSSLKEVVVADEEPHTDEKSPACVIFKKLKTLHLTKLPSLVGFCTGDCNFEFPSLEQVAVVVCLNMTMFSCGSTVTHNLKNVNLTEYPSIHDKRRWEGDLNSTIREMYREMDGFQEIGKITLSEFPQLIEKWHGESSFQLSHNVHTVVVDNCRSLSIVVPSNRLPLLKKLRNLVVKNCDSVEQVFNCDSVDDNQLVNCDSDEEFCYGLQLSNLPKLRHIWNESSLGISGFWKLTSLKVHNCSRLAYIFPLSVARSLSQLKILEIDSCRNVEAIVVDEDDRGCKEVAAPCFYFPKLTSLKLSRLPHMTMLYRGECAIELPKLKYLQVSLCGQAIVTHPGTFYEQGSPVEEELGHTMPQRPAFLANYNIYRNLEELSIDGRSFKTIADSPSWIEFLDKLKSLELCSYQGTTLLGVSAMEFFKRLSSLENLSVSSSSFVKLISYNEEDSLRFSHLRVRSLRLDSIGSMKHLWELTSQNDLFLSSLSILDLWFCDDLINLVPSSSVASFWNLTSLKVSFCRRLTTLITTPTAKTMAQLEKLEIRYCSSLKEIIVADEEQDKDKKARACVIFRKLKTLHLTKLPSLMGFCMSGCNFEFPSLGQVVVDGCPNMTMFSCGETIAPNLKDINVTEYSSGNNKPRWEGDLNSTIRRMYKEMDGFQGIGNVTLSEFPQLSEMWHGKSSFQLSGYLHKFVVDNCMSLSIAVPSNRLPLLKGLSHLVIENCDSVEEVFDLEGLDDNELVICNSDSEFSYELQLNDLPKLRDIWTDSCLGISGFWKLRSLEVHNCSRLVYIFPLPVALGLRKLSRLEVKGCGAVEAIIKKGEEEAAQDGQTLFQSLNSIKFEHLPNLIYFYPSGHVLKFPGLTEISVVDCPKITYASTCPRSEQDPSTSLERNEQQSDKGYIGVPTLQFLNGQVEISSLKKMKIDWDGAKNKIWHELFSATFLSKLQVVKLIGFPDNSSLLPSNFLLSLTNLETLVVGDCFCKEIFPESLNIIEEQAESTTKLKKLKLFNLPMMDHLVGKEFKHIRILQSLKILVVSKCNRLTILLTSSTTRGLQKLEQLVVEECQSLSEIVASEGDGVECDIKFNHLKRLELTSLPCLSSFSSGSNAFNFPLLNEVIIRDCPGMKTFAEKVLTTPALQNVQIMENDEVDWRWEGGLNNTIEKLFKEKNLVNVKED